MKIRELMTTEVEACTPTTSLAAAVEGLWRRQCGVLPVVDDDQRVVGMITDRDIAIALGTRGLHATEVPVRDVMTSVVFTCRPDDDIGRALDAMKAHRIRRIPIVDLWQRVVGILSIDDVARAASERDRAKVAETLGAIAETNPTLAP